MKLQNRISMMAMLSIMAPTLVLAHGDGAPQPVDTSSLKPLGNEWLSANPYRGDEEALKVGELGYNANCARCHGLEVKSGGLAPDLRYLEADDYGDEWYLMRVRKGSVHNGAVRMPPFEEILSQEAMWAIREFIDSQPED